MAGHRRRPYSSGRWCLDSPVGCKNTISLSYMFNMKTWCSEA
jgi:hypothetical protein